MSNEEPRAYTPEEVRKMFLKHISTMVSYWGGEKGSNVPASYSSKQRLEGLVHSILVMFDGGSGDMPAFDIFPAPHPDDKQYHIDTGSNWYDSGMLVNDCQLHDEYNAMRRGA